MFAFIEIGIYPYIKHCFYISGWHVKEELPLRPAMARTMTSKRLGPKA